MAKNEHTPSGPLKPLDNFGTIIQDVGDVLYDLPEQAPQERYVDFAQRLVEALNDYGLDIVRCT